MPQEVRNEVSGNVQKNAFVLQTGVLSFHRHEMGRRVWWPDLVALTALCLVWP
ncbi:hypothetical protein LFM09_22690 [Lentzea alba]|uniref:hypothetical protein n=1 Tax=Lentzea alba TaxID=2714351 RepID=UPI0039BFD1A5